MLERLDVTDCGLGPDLEALISALVQVATVERASVLVRGAENAGRGCCPFVPDIAITDTCPCNMPTCMDESSSHITFGIFLWCA